jgi:hypothetical protein
LPVWPRADMRCSAQIDTEIVKVHPHGVVSKSRAVFSEDGAYRQSNDLVNDNLYEDHNAADHDVNCGSHGSLQ